MPGSSTARNSQRPLVYWASTNGSRSSLFPVHVSSHRIFPKGRLKNNFDDLIYSEIQGQGGLKEANNTAPPILRGWSSLPMTWRTVGSSTAEERGSADDGCLFSVRRQEPSRRKMERGRIGGELYRKFLHSARRCLIATGLASMAKEFCSASDPIQDDRCDRRCSNWRCRARRTRIADCR